MCRLFGMHAGITAVSAQFWLLDAPDSLEAQSHRNPDGAGVGCFEADGAPVVDKQPLSAWKDREFRSAAHEMSGTTFVAHVRYASTGGHTMANTHPFVQQSRLFAHNGVVQELDRLDARLADLDARGLVRGETDSERVFALITAETARNGGNVAAGLMAAINWIGRTLPVYALNLVISTATELWALRYPDTHALYVLERPAGGSGTSRHLDARSDRIRARSTPLAIQPAVIVATERMDDDPAWRLLEPGELVHVDAGLTANSSTPFRPPDHVLLPSDLDSVAAASQHPQSA
jgi:glutamine amidotransferase